MVFTPLSFFEFSLEISWDSSPLGNNDRYLITLDSAMEQNVAALCIARFNHNPHSQLVQQEFGKKYHASANFRY